MVLVVEDEPLLRWLAVDMVEDGGSRLWRRTAQTRPCAFWRAGSISALVFTDIDMPGGVDGLKLAAMIRDRWPPIAIIITSGKRAPMAKDMPVGALFFAKPYRPEEVMAAMRRMTL